MVPEAPLEPSEGGLVPQGEGWFVVNAREARWYDSDFGPFTRFEGDGEAKFKEIGINIGVLQPGQPACAAALFEVACAGPCCWREGGGRRARAVHPQGHLLAAADQFQGFEKLGFAPREVELVRDGSEADRQERRAGDREPPHRRVVRAHGVRAHLRSLVHLAGQREQGSRGKGAHRLAQRAAHLPGRRRVGEAVHVEGRAHFFLARGCTRSAAQSSAFRRR